MEDSTESSHDVVLGRDLLNVLGVDIKISEPTIVGGT